MSNSSSPSKDNLLQKIWAISTTFTDEAMASASAKAEQLGFDTNRGLVPLAESFINLSSARAILEDAIEKQKLIQLPITVQKTLLANLETVATSLQGLSSGRDEIANLSSAIEVLNTSIWSFGLHNLSDQVLGYQQKLNQLKNQELQISRVLKQLEAAQTLAEEIATTARETNKKNDEAQALLDQIKQGSDNSSSLLQEIREAQNQTSSLYATIQQHEKQSGELASSIRTSSNELKSLDASIRQFYADVDEYRKKITQASDNVGKVIASSEAAVKKLSDDLKAAVETEIESVQSTAKATVAELVQKADESVRDVAQKTSQLLDETRERVGVLTSNAEQTLESRIQQAEGVTNEFLAETKKTMKELELRLSERSESTIGLNEKKTNELIAELAKLKEQIREQIQQATGFTLFGAFQTRQNEIAKSKNIWVYAIAGLVLVSAGVTIWIAHEAQLYTAHSFAFWVKLSLTIPLGFAITFCTVQYSRERRLEEEYAFKSSISVSLNPYRDLVQSIIAQEGQIDQGKYTEFVISSVNNVFTSPTEKVFDNEAKPGISKKMLKETLEMVGSFVKAAK